MDDRRNQRGRDYRQPQRRERGEDDRPPQREREYRTTQREDRPERISPARDRPMRDREGKPEVKRTRDKLTLPTLDFSFFWNPRGRKR